MSDRFNPRLSPNEEAVAQKARPAKRLPILCLDFDGVLHGYQSGWQGAAIIPDPPVPGAVEFLHGAVERFQVAIYSSRSGQPGGIDAMRGWLMMHVMAAIDDRREAEHVLGLIQWPTEKPAAIVSIDDRAVTFTGRWPSLDEIAGFTPWNRRPATAPAAPEPAAGGELQVLLRRAKWIGQHTTPDEFTARAVFDDREDAHEAYRALVALRDGSLALSVSEEGAPAGWKLVPIELTDRMLEDGGQCLPPTSTLSYCYACFRDAWAAAINASPPPPSTPTRADASAEGRRA